VFVGRTELRGGKKSGRRVINFARSFAF